MSPAGLKASNMLLGKSRGELPIVMNRFKGLDLVNRVSEELLTEIRNTVHQRHCFTYSGNLISSLLLWR